MQISSWYGIGSTLKQLKDEYPELYEELKPLVKTHIYTRYILTNVDTSLASTDEKVMELYASLVENDKVKKEILGLLQDELELIEKNRTIDNDNKRLKELISSKNKFFTIIGHDLKNLIGSLTQLGEILKDEFKSLNSEERGLTLVSSKDSIQLVTKPKFGELLKEIANEDLDSNLSPASMETLSIIAYLGPCRRSFVDHIRGVNSSFILRSLIVRGLVERGTDEKKANVYTYQVTFAFLRHIGVDNIKELPDYDKYREFVAKFTGDNEG